MSGSLLCYRCGESLVSLTLPFSRYDECPSCTIPLRVCRMCRHYDKDVPKQCSEDDAEEVLDKKKLNFCDWFVPGEGLFDASSAGREAKAQQDLEALFGESDKAATESRADPLLKQAEDLFK